MILRALGVKVVAKRWKSYIIQVLGLSVSGSGGGLTVCYTTAIRGLQGKRRSSLRLLEYKHTMGLPKSEA